MPLVSELALGPYEANAGEGRFGGRSQKRTCALVEQAVTRIVVLIHTCTILP